MYKMYKIEKISWENRHKLYFSSDWHIFHDPSWPVPIWDMRGALNAQDFAERTLALINETVPEDGILYYLGDLALNASDEQVINWLSGIRCKNIRKLWGNHESNTYRLYKQEVLKQYGRDDIEVYPLTMGNVTFIGNHVEIQVGKKRIVMNHFPLKIWNGGNRSAWHINGHSHLSDKQRLPEYPVGKTLDVGIDIGKIWTFEELEDVMSTKSVSILDHHDSSVR